MPKEAIYLLIPLAIIVIIITVLLITSFRSKKVDKDSKLEILGKNEEDDSQGVEKLDVGVWKKILKIVIKDKKSIIIMIVSSISLALLDIVNPLLNTYAMNQFFSEHPDFSTRYWYFGALLAIAIATGLVVFLFIRTAAKVEENTTYTIRMEAFDNLQRLSFSYYDINSSGWVMARMTSDARRLASIVSWGIVDLLWGIVLMIGILIASFIVNWRLALVLLALCPIFLGFAIYYRKKILKEYRSVRKVNSAITASFNESFMGANTSKTLVIEENNQKEFKFLTSKMRRRSVKAAVFSSLFWPVILVIGYLGVSIVSIIGGGFVLSDNPDLIITTATLYLFIDYAMRFFDPVMQLARVIADFQQAQASAERVLSLIETNSDIEDSPEVVEKYGTIYDKKKENWEKLNGTIEFKDVTFRYKNTNTNILEEFNLQINEGETVAFVGETGSGKSTIVNLICRFYEPTEGKVLIDGRDYRERSISWLHDNIGYVLQTPYLFNVSIMENIRYGKLDASDEEVIAASKVVNAHEFVEKLPDGYNTKIGEGGNMLSIGQKQLISFARAIIANPSILVLDEATSSIDTENEKIIQDALKVLLKDRTSLVVAHRLSTVVDADKIIVLRNGKILENGTHNELLKQKGYYFQLYRNQFIQEMEEKLQIEL